MNTPRSKPIVRHPNLRTTPKGPQYILPGGRGTGELTSPEFLVAVGKIVTRWVHLEETMAMFMGTLFGPADYAHARLIFRSVNSAQARIDIMLSLLEESPANADKGPVYDEIIAEFESLTKERNNYVHGLWWTGDNGEVTRSDPSYTNERLSWMLAKGVKIEDADRVIARIGALSNKILNEFVAEKERLKARLPPSSTAD